MKLLFDQNISYRLIDKINDIFPEGIQVKKLNLENVSDKEIWRFAKENNYTIVTFDSEFFDLAMIFGHPPKIIWLRTGNTTTNNLEKLLRKKADIIKEFNEHNSLKHLGCLEINE